MNSFPAGDVAVVVGSAGGIGAALLAAIRETGRFSHTLELARTTHPSIDLLDETSIAESAGWVASKGTPRLVIVASGLLHRDGISPEKSLRQLDPAVMSAMFAINTVGPAMVMKHFLPLLPRTGKAVFCALSARVGSIGDNSLGGWFSYRASKAALNQLIHTGAIDVGRRARETICVALHPGTVDTTLSAPFHKGGLEVQTPAMASRRLLDVVDRLGITNSGGFFDQFGRTVPW